MYHHVSSTVPADPLQFGLTVTTADFGQQLDYLRSHGYTSITLADLFDAMYHNGPLPPKPVILTFDDGYEDAFTDAFPLLQERGFKGTFAIVTGFVGSPGYLTWEQIKAMAGAGMEFASHTVNHIDLNIASEETIRDELASSKRTLEEQLRRPVDFFVYPSGEPFRSGSEARQQAVIGLLGETGYVGALLAGPSSKVQDPKLPYQLNRLRISGGESLETFVALLS